MSNINISVTEQDPINVSIASPEVQNVDISAQSISATVTDGDKGDIVVTGNGTVWTLDPNALATRVPYTGATSDVNLGEFGLLTGNLEFDTTPTNAPTGAGSMVWNDTEGTVDLVLKGGNLVLPIGQKQTIRAVNGTGGNLTRAQYRAVKITGAQGQRLQVSLARADNDANSKDTIGIVGEDISNNQTGFIVSSGLIEEINTTGSLQGETWADGDTLYLSGTTFGVITNVKPAAPIHTVILGFVVYAHANHGKIYVKVDNGYELDELHNCNVSTAASGDYLRYNGTTWVDATISAADLPSSIDAAKIATGTVSNTEFGYLDGVTSAIQTQINSKQATLSLTTTGTSGAATLVGATLNIPQYQSVLTNPVTGTGTTNYLPKFTGASTVADSQIFDNGTTVGVGTATPNATYRLDIIGGLRATGSSIFTGAYVDTSNVAIVANASIPGISLRSTSQGRLSIVTNYAAGDTTSFLVGTGMNNPTTNAIHIVHGSGNVVLNGAADAGYKLDIQGTLRTTSDFTLGGNTIISNQNTYLTTSVANGYTGLNLRPNGTGSISLLAVYSANDVNNSGYLQFASNGNIQTGKTGTGVTPDMKFYIGTNLPMRIQANVSADNILFLTGTNAIFGGTTDAGYKVDVQGTLRNTTSAYFATSSGAVGIRTTTITSGVVLNVAGISEFRGSAYFGQSSATNSVAYFFNANNDNRGEISFDGVNNYFKIASSYGGGGSFRPMVFFTGGAEGLRLDGYGNLGMSQTTFGTSAQKTLAIGSGVAPTTSPADAFQLYSADITAGNAAPHFRTEGGAVVKLYQQTTGVGAATRVGGGGTTVTDTDTFDGYTLNQIVKALRNAGFLA